MRRRLSEHPIFRAFFAFLFKFVGSARPATNKLTTIQMLRRTEEPAIDTNWSGYYSTLSNTLQSSATLLKAVQAKSRTRLTLIHLGPAPPMPPTPVVQTPAKTEIMADWEVAQALVGPPALAPCYPESPISFPSRKRPHPVRNESEESLVF